MGYEIDFIGVGTESKSGDAIAIRFGDLHGYRHDQTVVIIDGGFNDTGTELVKHVKNHYQTDIIDVLINTHPDQDHINGLIEVMQELTINELWMHMPWNHNNGLAEKFKDGRITDNSISDQLKNNLEKAYELYQLAINQGVTVVEPFTGVMDNSNCVKVLGPRIDYYEDLIPEFDGMPATKSTATESNSLFGLMLDAVKRCFAIWGDDKINNDGVTSAKNSSSVITQIIVDGKRMIFTGDAGIDALSYAADQVDQCFDPAQLTFFQVPHHGSRRNIGPDVLDRFIGGPVSEGETRSITAIASTAKKGEPKHPRKSVLNAFTHRGVKVLATRGSGIRHHSGAPAREGWGSLDAEPYHYEYEEEA